MQRQQEIRGRDHLPPTRILNDGYCRVIHLQTNIRHVKCHILHSQIKMCGGAIDSFSTDNKGCIERGLHGCDVIISSSTAMLAGLYGHSSFELHADLSILTY